MAQSAMHFQPTITAVLGATNTGKTHYAVERMCAHKSGIIGLPLRLLAREVYDKICDQHGKNACALITGEEKIIPPYARFFVCTVEAMPMDAIRRGQFASVIIDEVQMMDHPERGHVFTDRVLHARGTEETLFLGSLTVRDLLTRLVPRIKFITRERFSILSYQGHLKLNRLPKRSVIVAFSAPQVYALAEFMRRAYGGSALVMGGLSPRTRNAQAELYQSGEVDYMVATDAIGMGLNLDVDHVAFAGLRKFDGQRKRYLYAHEIAQIAGRAGRFRQDGSFGTTGKSLPLDDDVILRVENHSFEPVRAAQWRANDLSFKTIEHLQDSLAAHAPSRSLHRIAPASDEMAFDRLIKLGDVTQFIRSQDRVRLFWEVCCIPDFRNLGPEAHARLLEDIFTQLVQNQHRISDAYLNAQTSRLDHIEGNVEILSSRLANMRTWTYISNKSLWLCKGKTSDFWINQTQLIENRLSDVLHKKLVARFVDRRTSALLKGIGANTHMKAEITSTGEVQAQGHTLGHLIGLVFKPGDTHGELDEKTVNAAAAIALAPEIDRRLTQITGAEHAGITLNDQCQMVWSDVVIGTLSAGPTLLKPVAKLLGGELGSPVLRDQASARLQDFINTEIEQKFATLVTIKAFVEDPQTYQGARGLAHILWENHGMIPRLEHLQLIKDTDQTARGYLRKLSVQIGYHHVFLRDMLKPAPARLLSLLFGFAWEKNGGGHKKPFMPPNGMASTPDDAQYSEAALNMAGYTRVANRIIRFDMLARLSQMLMQASNAAPNKSFRIAQEMMALLGCSYEDMENILGRLGYDQSSHELSEAEVKAEQNDLVEFLDVLKAQDAKTTEPVAIVEEKQTTTDKNQTPQPTKPASTNIDEPIEAPNTDSPKTGAPASAIDAAKAEPEKPAKTATKKSKPYWEKPLTIYRPRPETDDDGAPVLATHIVVWKRNFKKPSYTARSFAARQDAKQSGNQPRNGQDNPDGFSAGHTSNRQSRAQKLGEFGNQNGRQKNAKQGRAKHQNKGKPSGTKSKNWSAPINPEDSPFAALAALKTTSNTKKGS